MKIQKEDNSFLILFKEEELSPEWDDLLLKELKGSCRWYEDKFGFVLPENERTILAVRFLKEEYRAEVSAEVSEKLQAQENIFKAKEEVDRYKPLYPLKQHQKEALEKVLIRPALALFHDPGLGKTKTILDMFLLRRNTEPDLKLFVICPNFLVLNWREEVKKHAPSLRFVPLHNGTDAKLKNLKIQADVYCTNVEGLAPRSYGIEYIGNDGKVKIKKMKADSFQRALTEFLGQGKFIGVIDESTSIKNPTAKTTKFCLSMKDLFRYRYILTGTPIPNNLLDIWSQLSFLDSMATGFDKFHNFKTFHFEFTGEWQQTLVRVRFEKTLYENIGRWADIKKKEQCYDLPEKIYKVTYVEMLPAVRKKYDELINRCKTEFQTMQKQNVTIEKSHILSKAQTLMQVCKGFFFSQEFNGDMESPKVMNELHRIECSKYDTLLEILSSEYADSKCIIWTTHIPERILLTEFLTAKKVKFECLFPEMKAEEIQERIKKFQEGKITRLVCSLQSFNKGITLTTADVEIFFSNTYNWEMRAQAEDRTHRIGTVKSPIYHDIITEKSIEELIFRNLIKKGNFAQEFIEELTK